METDETLSSQLFNYLCEVVGSEQTVSARRWFFKIFDDCFNAVIDNGNNCYAGLISSGSKGEGLNFSDSDLDLMYVLEIQVCGSRGNTKSNSDLLCYDMEYSQPGYCKIKVCPSQFIDGLYNVLNRFGDYCPLITATALYTGSEIIISSENFKQYFQTLPLINMKSCKQLFHTLPDIHTTLLKLHGPCITSNDDKLDLAYCLHCPAWPSEASRWISRNRTSHWPSVSIVSKIVQEGILFVPIGGINVESSCEWRISFSVAEKLLIHSLNHTQFLCYALLKFILKEIINKVPDLHNLLCSYFMKTVLFWILEELDARVWTQEKLLACFQHCLKRLVYFVDCGYCPNYFLPENNMFKNKIYGDRQRRLGSFLRDLYAGGILYVVMSCTSLSGFLNMTTRIKSTAEEIDQGAYPLLPSLFTYIVYEEIPAFFLSRILKRIHFHSRHVPKFARSLYMINLTHIIFRFLSFHLCYNDQLCNRQLHKAYKAIRCLLLIGTGWDVSDWLFLAMFFYSHRQFCHALTVVEFVGSECNENRTFYSFSDKLKLSSARKKLEQLSFVRRYKLTCAHDVFLNGLYIGNSFAHLFYRDLFFPKSILTMKLKGTLSDDLRCMFGDGFFKRLKEDRALKKCLCHAIMTLSDEVKSDNVVMLGYVFPTSLVHYIRFMCFHHLGNHDERQHSLYDLKATVNQLYHASTYYVWLFSSCILLERAIAISGSDIDTIPYAEKVAEEAIRVISSINCDI